jgi:hypothetical protein
MFTIKFYGERDIEIETGEYRNGRLAVQLHEKGEYFATVSVNLPEEQLADDEFAFKNYSENEGLFEELLRVGAIVFTGRYTDSVLKLPICRLAEAVADYRPGEWKCVYSPYTELWCIVDEEGNHIGESRCLSGPEAMENPARSKRNAQLIAAVPLLLELLESLADWCDSDAVWIDQRGTVAAVIDEAIRLAKGRANDAGPTRRAVCWLSEHAAVVNDSNTER